MTDNEKLIEEAAERVYPDTEWSQRATMIAFRDAFARGWREAEKAHTPTNDEREALDLVIEDSIERWGDEFPTPQVAAYVAADVRAAGFRRSEVPEPSAEAKHDESCAEWCNHCTVCGVGTRYGSRCPEHYRNRPQGEPSDARIRQAVLDGLAEASVLQSPFQPQTRELVVEQITLALRAAGGVR